MLQKAPDIAKCLSAFHQHNYTTGKVGMERNKSNWLGEREADECNLILFLLKQ